MIVLLLAAAACCLLALTNGELPKLDIDRYTSDLSEYAYLVGRSVYLKDKNILTIPNLRQREILNLDLSYNHIRIINQTNLYDPILQNLSLSNNQIEFICKDFFADLVNLFNLNLSHNLLRIVDLKFTFTNRNLSYYNKIINLNKFELILSNNALDKSLKIESVSTLKEKMELFLYIENTGLTMGPILQLENVDPTLITNWAATLFHSYFYFNLIVSLAFFFFFIE